MRRIQAAAKARYTPSSSYCTVEKLEDWVAGSANYHGELFADVIVELFETSAQKAEWEAKYPDRAKKEGNRETWRDTFIEDLTRVRSRSSTRTICPELLLNKTRRVKPGF